jgi:quercetin dioxygenase-like cupin family protein
LSASAHDNEKKKMVVTPYQDARFAPIDPKQPDGPQIAVLWGDPAKGPSAMLLKLKKGGGRLHFHTSDYHLTLLQGTMKHWAEGESEADAKPLGPGSYWFQPGAQAHGDSCLTDECLMFVKWEGKRDGMLAETLKK